MRGNVAAREGICGRFNGHYELWRFGCSCGGLWCVVWDSVAEVAQVGRRCDWLAVDLIRVEGEKYGMCM